MNDPAVILAIDDTTESLALIVDVLTQRGYHVRPADSGELALRSLADWTPDLIILDIHMSGMDGIEVCRRLRADERTRYVPVILSSSFSDPKDWMRGLDTGASDFIAKPLHPEELASRVKTHLNLYRNQIELRKSLSERETLLRELYHRTKNTMTVIQAMLVLQAGEFPDNQELQQVVNDTADRIRTIALVHQMLYRTQDLSRVELGEYTRNLAKMVFESHGVEESRIALSVAVPEQSILLDTAIPYGQIVNELLHNSLKHAFPNGRRGTVSITLHRMGADRLHLDYSDDGVGFPPDFSLADSTTFGLRLIHGLVETQMLGKITLQPGPGVHYHIEFRCDLYADRINPT